MTPATKTTRETATSYRGRPLIATLTPRYLEIREKGRRDTLMVSYDVIYELALKLRWRKQQAEKKAAQRERTRRR
jgi:hypothetical protein